MMSEVGQLRPFSSRDSARSPQHLSAVSRRDRPRNSIPVLAAAMCLLLSACSSNLILSSGPKPRVEDCMLLQQATPSRYVCGGKTYTAVQLAEIRKGAVAGIR